MAYWMNHCFLSAKEFYCEVFSVNSMSWIFVICFFHKTVLLYTSSYHISSCILLIYVWTVCKPNIYDLMCSYLVPKKGASPQQLEDVEKFLQLVSTGFLAPFCQYSVLVSLHYSLLVDLKLLFSVSLFLPFRSNM